MGRLAAACIALASLAAAAAPARADDPGAAQDDGPGSRFFTRDLPVEFEADSFEYEVGRELYVGRGNVRMRQGDRLLTADWVAFSNSTGRGAASGNVEFSDGVDTVRTELIEFEVETLQGVMFQAEFEVPSDRMELRGAEIAKTGDKTYRFREGEFTTCQCPDPDAREPWQIKADEAELEIEGYGTARNTTVEILGVPVLWFPWMIYPLKTERQTGLLFPEFGLSGRNGVELGFPVFVAAGDPVNLVLTPRWLQKRGFKGDVGFEYVLGEHSGGSGLGSFLYDQDVDPGSRRTPFDKERWATRGSHDFFLPFGWRLKTRYAFASDNSHPSDFDDLSGYRVDRYLPARAFGGRSFLDAGALGLWGGAAYFDDLQNPDDTDRDEFVLNRLPEARFHVLPMAMPFASFLAPALDVRYAWYQQAERPQKEFTDDLLVTGNGRFFDSGIDGIGTSQEQGRTTSAPPGDPNQDNNPMIGGSIAGGTEGDGIFQEGELLADDGHRLLLTPRLGMPFRFFDALELYPEVGWYETLYQSAAQGFEQRGFLTARMDLRTRFRGVFGPVTHLLEPRLGYAYADTPDQSGDPLYLPATAVPQRRVRELDLENVTRDPADRIASFNGLTVALGNRFYGRGDAAAKLLGDFVLSALYDFERSRFGNIYLDGAAYPFRQTRARFSVGFDPEDAKLSEALLGFGWADDRGDRADLSYRYLRDIPAFFEDFPRENHRFENFKTGIDAINQVNLAVRVAITRQWGLTYRLAYTFEQNLFLGNEGGIEFISKCRCWAIRLEVRESRSRGATVGVEYRILGLGDDSRSPFDSPAKLFGVLNPY